MNLKKKAAEIKMILFDVDGTLTDGRIYLTDSGQEIKVFDVRDGQGITIARILGIDIGFISGRESGAVWKRAAELDVRWVFLGIRSKILALEKIREKCGIQNDQVAFLGDDIGDLSLLEKVGLPAAVNDAHPAVKAAAAYICRRKGGQGAAREFIEFILKAQRKEIAR